ncbi:MAG: lipoprotein signal peptidase [Bacteroidales bacterium]|nr:lipoprotein signal peptidase [Bacteroidales bacterium]
MKKSLITIFIVLFIDQLSKFLVKLNMQLGDEINVAGNWFIIHFTENYGMAFGMEFGGEMGKVILTLFRILAVAFIGWYIYGLHKKNAHQGLIICISLIFAGALGNIIDSAFYGVIFNESFFQTASLFPPEGGYAGFLHGRVVDMLYFPIFKGYLPDWIPFWGGDHAIFFRPVFNIADASITVGVFIILIFQKRFFKNF